MKNTIIVIVILLIIGFGGYAYFKNKDVEVSEKVENNEINSPIEKDNAKVENIPVVNTSTENIKEFTVSGKNFSFAPNKISVKKGDTVKITFKNSDGFHDFKIDEYNVATKQIASGVQESVTFIADKTGSFVYYCSVGKHRANGMWGTLTVE